MMREMKKEKDIIGVTGMDCAACAMTIEKALKNKNGVL